MNILLFTPGPKEDPSTRYRFLQFKDSLKRQGHSLSYHPYFTRYLYKIKNKHGYHFDILKIILVLYCSLRRLFLALVLPYYFDLVIIHREAFPFGSPFVEKLIKSLNKNTIYDYDDAVYAYPKENLSWRGSWYDPKRVDKILKLVKGVTAGNDYLSNYAKKFNKNAFIIPTTVNLNEYKQKEIVGGDGIVLGWIGTYSNLKYLKIIAEPLAELTKKYPNLTLKIVSSPAGKKFTLPGVNIEYKDWKLSEEVSDIRSFDIGLMPLYNSEWERGKCGFKLIQYMATGLPTVSSSVGANRDIIADGENGFLADTPQEWYQNIAELSQNIDLRKKIGHAARHTVGRRYSAEIVLPQMITIWKTIVG